MLVLTRKADESIVIGGRIRIKVLRLRGNRIRLGIEAPDDMPVRRAELAPRDHAPQSRDQVAEEHEPEEVELSASDRMALALLVPGTSADSRD